MHDIEETAYLNPAPEASAPALRGFAALGFGPAVVAHLLAHPVEAVDAWFTGAPMPRPLALALELLLLAYTKMSTEQLGKRDRALDPSGFGAMAVAKMQLVLACIEDQHAENEAATDEDCEAAMRFMDEYHTGTARKDRWETALAMITAAGSQQH